MVDVNIKVNLTFDVRGLSEQQARELIDILEHYPNSSLRDVLDQLGKDYQVAYETKQKLQK